MISPGAAIRIFASIARQNRYKGKIKKVYERLNRGDLIDTSHYEVFLLLYVATRKAIDHISYWASGLLPRTGTSRFRSGYSASSKKTKR